MFGHNKIVTPKRFADQSSDTLIVTSIFYTLQGEGPYSGRPAIFVRLAGCNLQCSFCDTYFDSGDCLTFDQIIHTARQRVAAFVMDNGVTLPDDPIKLPMFVITGGEPTMQPHLRQFIAKLTEEAQVCVQIESNGNFWFEPGPAHLVLSPKINEKTGKYIKLHPTTLARAQTLKFVISATMPGYQDIPDWALEWRDHQHWWLRRQIYVSPMNCYARQPVKLGPDGTLEGRSETDERISFWTPGLLDMAANQANHEHAARVAMRHGLILTLQTHLMANLP